MHCDKNKTLHSYCGREQQNIDGSHYLWQKRPSIAINIRCARSSLFTIQALELSTRLDAKDIMSMEDYINMYDIVGQHESASSVQWKNTDTNGGRNAYTVLRKFQETPNEYQEPLHYPCHEQYQQDKASNVEADSVDTSNIVNEQNTFSAVKQCNMNPALSFRRLRYVFVCSLSYSSSHC